jgi:hypothetical protein
MICIRVPKYVERTAIKDKITTVVNLCTHGSVNNNLNNDWRTVKA